MDHLTTPPPVCERTGCLQPSIASWTFNAGGHYFATAICEQHWLDFLIGPSRPAVQAERHHRVG